jgi:RNA polymerase sigma factor for flagellar operon FliA
VSDSETDPLEPKQATDAMALIEDGQGLVRSLALKTLRSLPIRADLDDLIAYGQLGLAEAAQAFDPEQGVRFTTFAYYRIRGAIYDGVSKMTWTSRARLRRLRFQAMADEVLEGQRDADSGGHPTAEEDASWLGRVTERLAVVYLATADSDDPHAASAIDTAVDSHEPPSKIVADSELQRKLRDFVDDLPVDARRLIVSIYFDGYTLTQAAQRCGISKSWASRVHAKSLDQLANRLHTSRD